MKIYLLIKTYIWKENIQSEIIYLSWLTFFFSSPKFWLTVQSLFLIKNNQSNTQNTTVQSSINLSARVYSMLCDYVCASMTTYKWCIMSYYIYYLENRKVLWFHMLSFWVNSVSFFFYCKELLFFILLKDAQNLNVISLLHMWENQ